MAKEAAEGAKKATGGISLIAIVIITLLGAGAGGFFGMQLPSLTKAEKPKAEAPAEPEKKPPPTAIVQALPPITTNLAQPSATWIRLELSIVIGADMGPDANVIAAKMSEDIIGYLQDLVDRSDRRTERLPAPARGSQRPGPGA